MSTTRMRFGAVITAGILGLGLSACGGDSDGESASSPEAATQPSGRMRRPSQVPSFSISRPSRAWSSAWVTMPPPQWPPPGTDTTGSPPMSTTEVR